jgi:hypothetical protein
MKKIILLGSVLGLTPLVTFAATTTWTVLDIIAKVNQVLNYIIPVLITLAVVYFIWGVIQYTVSGDEEKKKSARGMIISGLIGLFIIVAFWGIIRIFTNTFAINNDQIQKADIPCVPGLGSPCDTAVTPAP